MKTFPVAVVGLLLLPGLTLAQEKTDPAQILVGVAKLHLNAEYVSIRVDGLEYEDSFFEDEGLTLILDSMDRSKEHTLALTPVSEELKPETVKLSPKEWKLVKLDKETRQWQVERTIKLAKWKPGEREKWLEEQKKLEEERLKKEMPPVEETPGEATEPTGGEPSDKGTPAEDGPPEEGDKTEGKDDGATPEKPTTEDPPAAQPDPAPAPTDPAPAPTDPAPAPTAPAPAPTDPAPAPTDPAPAPTDPAPAPPVDAGK